MPTTYIRNGETWPKVKKAFIRNGGAWSEIKTIWVRNSGAWNKYFVNLVTVNVVQSQNNINLKDLYVNQTGENPSSGVSVLFNINANMGSTSASTASIVTGSWPSESEITISIANGVYVAGAGGGSHTAGGSGISLGYNVAIINNGVIAGGGGGGGSVAYSGGHYAGGGSGAGLVNGFLYSQTGGGSFSFYSFSTQITGTGGTGGALGSAGGSSGGSAQGQFATRYSAGAGGSSIQENGYTATISGSGSRIN
jgi:hypothetical protein